MARASGERAVTVAVADIRRMAVAAPTSIQRPVPRDSAVTPKLTPIHFDFDNLDIRPGDAATLNAKARWRDPTSPGDFLVSSPSRQLGDLAQFVSPRTSAAAGSS